MRLLRGKMELMELMIWAACTLYDLYELKSQCGVLQQASLGRLARLTAC